MVLDCCLKPSHDLGRQQWFWQYFRILLQKLADHKIHRMVTACPSCHWIFREYGTSLEVVSAFEVLDKNDVGKIETSKFFQIHDACTARYETGMQEAVRELIRCQGVELHESGHAGKKAICCGLGGGVFCVAPELADRWSKRRSKESTDIAQITYCGGCTDVLSRTVPTTHILDLLYDPQRALTGETRITSGLPAYRNRLRFKNRLNKDNLTITRVTRSPKNVLFAIIMSAMLFGVLLLYGLSVLFSS